MIIIISEKPDFGNLQRTCKVCSETYQGWDMYLCHECTTVPVDIIETW